MSPGRGGECIFETLELIASDKAHRRNILHKYAVHLHQLLANRKARGRLRLRFPSNPGPSLRYNSVLVRRVKNPHEFVSRNGLIRQSGGDHAGRCGFGCGRKLPLLPKLGGCRFLGNAKLLHA